MSETDIANALGVLGTLLFVARAVPSAFHVLRTRKVDPGETLGIDLLTISGIWWVLYGLEINNVPVLVSSAAGLLPGLVTLVLLWRADELHGRAVAILAAGILLIPIGIESTRLAGAIAAVLGAVIALPEALSLVRDPDRADEEISLLTWLLVAMNAIVWLVYGILVEHPLLGAAGLVQLPSAAIVCVHAMRRRSSRGATRPPVSPPGSHPGPH